VRLASITGVSSGPEPESDAPSQKRYVSSLYGRYFQAIVAPELNCFDVLIVGAGPSGLAAAITARLAGLSVAVLDRPRAHLPAPPPESLLPGCESILGGLGLAEAYPATQLSSYVGIRSQGRNVDFGSGDSGRWLGRHVCRTRFDQMLHDHAVALGVQFASVDRPLLPYFNGTQPVAIQAEGFSALASWVVDASGRKRWLGKSLRLARDMRSGRLIAWRGIGLGPPGSIDPEYPIFEAHQGVWWWLAQTTPGNYVWTQLSSAHARPTACPLVPGLDLQPGRPADVTWRLHRPVAAEGWLLVGDAAAVLDPAAGHGVFFALASGMRAALAVYRSIHQPSGTALHLAEYDGWVSDTYHQKASGLIQIYEEMGLASLANTESAILIMGG